MDMLEWMHLLGLFVFVLKRHYDIQLPISKLSSRTHHCTTIDLISLTRVAAYLYHTQHIGVTFHPNNGPALSAFIILCGAADAAYMILQECRSQIGGGIKLGDNHDLSGYFETYSTKEKDLPSSSAVNAEIKSAFELAKFIIVYRGISLEIFGIEQSEPTIILEDSSGTINICRDYSKGTRRLRHELQKICFLIEAVRMAIIKFQQVSSPEQPADSWTKPLGSTSHYIGIERQMGSHPAITEAKERA